MQLVFLGRLAEVFGRERNFDPDGHATIADVVQALGEETAEALQAPGVSYVLDQEVARLETPLGDASELAFLPPLSGG